MMRRAVALSQDQDTVAIKIALAFTPLTGSVDNGIALVHALRDGVSVRLMPSLTAITPPTGRMSWHDVKMALMLARYALQRHGIAHPSSVQLRTALTGGELATPSGDVEVLRGVLAMRAEGMHWGRIAAERFRQPLASDRAMEGRAAP